MSLENEYSKELIVWLERFSREVGGNDAHEELISKANTLLDRLYERDKKDMTKLVQLQREAEDLYLAYEHSNRTEEEVQRTKRIPVGKHKLPKLPYEYHQLEPYINRRIMELHHKKHHQSYVDGLNKAEKKLQEQRKTKFEEIKHWQRELAFNGAGHYLHSLFWEVMSPKGGGKPKGQLAKQIDQDFGGFQSFKNHFTEAAKNVEGGGWAILVWAPQAGRLEILTAEKHQNLSQWDVIPLLPLDVWEHAYYLQYENERERYINNWWNVVNWSFVEKRFLEISKNNWLV
ncbi:Fe-Mn family superoxide dismutase [Evansella vedderi]|uniref:superoxide dismutase n=1 Tax=Evansella vedderi TaxID=38282 RepID=A0ABU0A2I7_9BACI|nr:superoxide dismutase [Evansella vedderi]MDQ0257700.1 Fe-Mn family superoxide dismutase [Evansella vedderi]